jgi:hypothetical protein
MSFASWRPMFSPRYILDTPPLSTRLEVITSGLPCPAALASAAVANNLTILETVTDGNCGVDAVLSTCIANHFMSRNEDPWRRLRGLSEEDRLQHVRLCAVEWAVAHKKQLLWDDFTIADLVRGVSGLPFGEWSTRMQQPREWVDLAFLQALSCYLKIDILIMQPDSDITLIGASLLGIETPSLITIALVNNVHFWGTRPITTLQGSGDTDEVVVPLCCLHDDDEVFSHSVSSIPAFISDQRVSSELALCDVLMKWAPFAQPGDALLTALQGLAQESQASSTEGGLVCRALTRRGVIRQLSEEIAALQDSQSQHARRRDEEEGLFDGMVKNEFSKCMARA